MRHASNASAIFLADAQRIRELLPGDAFEVIESAPGRAELVLSLIDYIDNDLGDYNEVGVALSATPRGAGAEKRAANSGVESTGVVGLCAAPATNPLILPHHGVARSPTTWGQVSPRTSAARRELTESVSRPMVREP